MKNFIKLFFIYFCLFISLASNACTINWQTADFYPIQQVITSTTQQEELCINLDDKTNAIFVTNNSKNEISSLNLQKNNSFNGNFNKAATGSKLRQQNFAKKYNEQFYNSSYKISSYLKNEICTRAP